MAQYVAFSPHVEVLVAAVLAVVAGLGDAAAPILAKHGLAHVDPAGWYPQQQWLDAFREIAESDTGAIVDLVRIGRKIPENARWPSGIVTVEDALCSIDVAYHLNHRGGEIGCYRATKTGVNEMQLFCENPYPCDFDYGIIYATARLYLPRDAVFYVVHDDDAPCRKHGGDSCTYYVRW